MHISKGNTKVGKIPSVSLTPGESCPEGVPCRTGSLCYYKKAMMYPIVRQNCAANLRQARMDLEGFMIEIADYLRLFKPEFFRWHIGGDILDQKYLEGMKDTAWNFPCIKFLCFTKMHGLDFSRLPSNLAVVLSMWPGWGDTKKRMPRAWLQDGSETRIPDNAIHCPGACEGCASCWNLRDLKRDVYFSRH